jgi:hypothetical protein
MSERWRQLVPRPAGRQVLVSLLVVGLGLLGAEALQQVDQELRILYAEHTLGATDLAHVAADVMRFRNTILRALEAPTQKDFARITASLPDQRARIEAAVARAAAAGTRLSRSGRSEAEDLAGVRASLAAYFAAAEQTEALLRQLWQAPTAAAAAELRNRAEVHAADNAGPKLMAVSLALDRLLETVAEIGKEIREESGKTIRLLSMALVSGSLLLAAFTIMIGRPREASAAEVTLPSGQPPESSQRHPLNRI